MPTDPAALAALAIAAVMALAVLVALWRYSGSPEAPAGAWDRPPNVDQPSPVPPGFRLALELVESDWTDGPAWQELVERLDAVAVSLQATASEPHARTVAPSTPDKGWLQAELRRLEDHVFMDRHGAGTGPKGSTA